MLALLAFVLLLVSNFICIVESSARLVYFDAKGAAELSRVLMRIGGMEFEDFRFPIVAKEGGGFDTVEFSTAKSAGEFFANMDRVPLLVVNDKIIGQSKAIERYIANKCNLMGSNDEDRGIIDCITENVRDIKDKWGKIRMLGGFGSSPEKEAAISKWLN